MKNSMYFVIAVSVLFVGLRFILPNHGLDSRDVFKDFAHLWVGGLFGAAIAIRHRWLWTAAIAMTVAEVLAAIIRG